MTVTRTFFSYSFFTYCFSFLFLFLLLLTVPSIHSIVLKLHTSILYPSCYLLLFLSCFWSFLSSIPCSSSFCLFLSTFCYWLLLPSLHSLFLFLLTVSSFLLYLFPFLLTTEGCLSSFFLPSFQFLLPVSSYSSSYSVAIARNPWLAYWNNFPVASFHCKCEKLEWRVLGCQGQEVKGVVIIILKKKKKTISICVST